MMAAQSRSGRDDLDILVVAQLVTNERWTMLSGGVSQKGEREKKEGSDIELGISYVREGWNKVLSPL